MREIDFVNAENASKLKEHGFDEETCMYYSRWGELVKDHYFIDDVPAPTFQEAARWLRDNHKIEISISPGFPFVNGKQLFKYFWTLVEIKDNHLEYPLDSPESPDFHDIMVDSYEQGMNDAIKEALSRIDKKS